MNRELRRVHLTAADMNVLNAVSPSQWGANVKSWFAEAVWWSAPLMIGIYSFLGYRSFDVTWPQALVWSTLFWAVWAAGVVWVERQTRLSSTREEAGASGLCIAAGVFAVILTMISQLPWPQPMQRQGLLFTVIGLSLLLMVWSGWLWRKVRRARQVA